MLPTIKLTRKLSVYLTVVILTVLLIVEVAWIRRGRGGQEERDTRMVAELQYRLRGPLAYDAPDLLRIIRRKYLTPPSHLPYAFMRDRRDSEALSYNLYIVADLAYGTLQMLMLKVFDGVRDGFFVEAGAADGEFLSNTLTLELQQGWTGLLVEADGDMYRNLIKRHRKAWACHCCLAPLPYAHREILLKYSVIRSEDAFGMYSRGHALLASLEDLSPAKAIGGTVGNVNTLYESVQCLPLASLLLALNVTKVDLVSLDVEGAELGILESFPWGRISVDVWLVEHFTADGVDSDGSQDPQGTDIDPGHDNIHTALHKNSQNNRSLALSSINSNSNSTNNKNHSNSSHESNNPSTDNNKRHSNSTNNSKSNSNSSNTHHQQQHQHQQNGKAKFVNFFLSKGYVLYPVGVKKLLDNYIFVRKDSSPYRRLRLTQIET